MSEGRIYLIGFSGQLHDVLHSSLFPFLHFAFPSAGAIDKIVFPVGMQSVDFQQCYDLTGTAELG